jgi:phosphoserine phosphatase RsbU/P
MAIILVVDDEPDLEILIRQKFRRRIRANELEFVFAQNGVEALAKLDERPDIDMVLSDINMPVMDGLTLIGQLRDRAPMIKAVVVSAYGDMANIRTAMNRGAIDFVTKPIDFDDLENTVARTLEHLAMLRDAVTSRERLVALQQELDVAAKMQAQILPRAALANGGVAFGAHMTPAKEVGGDFYDYFQIDDDRVGFVIADVSGKGVPAAIFMAVSHTLIRARGMDDSSPAACVSLVNNALCRDNDEAMFVSAFYGVLDSASGKLCCCNAGHNPPLLRKADGTVEWFAAKGGPALGVIEDAAYEEMEIDFAPGDTLLLYTDGVTEAIDEDDVPFGEDALKDVFQRLGSADPSAVADIIETVAAEHTGEAEQFDDITCLVVRRPAA